MSCLLLLGQQLPRDISLGLRKQAEADVAFLRALYVARRWAEVSAAPGWTDSQRKAFLHSQADLQQRHYAQHYSAADFFIVEQHGQPIGRLCLLLDSQQARVVDIALLPGWQGQGLGSALLRAVLALADRQGLACHLSVEPFSPAQRLYARLGFEPCGQQGLYLQMCRLAPAPLAHQEE